MGHCLDLFFKGPGRAPGGLPEAKQERSWVHRCEKASIWRLTPPKRAVFDGSDPDRGDFDPDQQVEPLLRALFGRYLDGHEGVSQASGVFAQGCWVVFLCLEGLLGGELKGTSALPSEGGSSGNQVGVLVCAEGVFWEGNQGRIRGWFCPLVDALQLSSTEGTFVSLKGPF